MKQSTITARQLRHLLFAIDDQGMTVEQLRTILFEADQDKSHSIEDMGCWVNAVDTMRKIKHNQQDESYDADRHFYGGR